MVLRNRAPSEPLRGVFEFTQESAIACCWFIQHEQDTWMAMVMRQKPDTPWCARYRFRWNDRVLELGEVQTDDPQDPHAQAKLIDMIDVAAGKLLADAPAARLWRIPVNGGFADLLRLVAAYPWAHVDIIPPESPTVH